MSDRHRCPYCWSETCYQSFSGGREWYCSTCDTKGPVGHRHPLLTWPLAMVRSGMLR